MHDIMTSFALVVDKRKETRVRVRRQQQQTLVDETRQDKGSRRELKGIQKRHNHHHYSNNSSGYLVLLLICSNDDDNNNNENHNKNIDDFCGCCFGICLTIFIIQNENGIIMVVSYEILVHDLCPAICSRYDDCSFNEFFFFLLHTQSTASASAAALSTTIASSTTAA